MIVKNFKVTGSMLYILHAVFSIVLGALVSGLVFVGSTAFTGTADLKAVLLSGLTTVAVYFTSHISTLANTPQLAQAESDAFSELKGVVESHTQAISALQQFSAPVAPAPQFTTPAPQPARFVQQPLGASTTNAQPFSFQASQTYPTLTAVPTQTQQ